MPSVPPQTTTSKSGCSGSGSALVVTNVGGGPASRPTWRQEGGAQLGSMTDAYLRSKWVLGNSTHSKTYFVYSCALALCSPLLGSSSASSEH